MLWVQWCGRWPREWEVWKVGNGVPILLDPNLYMNTDSLYSLQPWRWRQHVPPKCGQHCPYLHSAKNLEQDQHLRGPTTNFKISKIIDFSYISHSHFFIWQLELGTSSINLAQLSRPATWGQRQSQSPERQKRKRTIMSKRLIILVIYHSH
jgi:hypothetical protein